MAVTVGLQIFGRGELMERGDFIHRMEVSFLANLEMAGVTEKAYG